MEVGNQLAVTSTNKFRSNNRSRQHLVCEEVEIFNEETEQEKRFNSENAKATYPLYEREFAKHQEGENQ